MAQTARSDPSTEPHFALTSSAVTGFFFCGMILLEAAYSSATSTKPNSFEDQRMVSSAILLISIISISQEERASTAKSRDETASIELSIIPVKPRREAISLLSRFTEVPASAAAPMGERLTLSYNWKNLSQSR